MNNFIFLLPYKHLAVVQRNQLQVIADTIMRNGGTDEDLLRLTGYPFTRGDYRANPPKE
jgi:hypothetical protein